ncbi:hypothetical protein [Nocardia wallacei]|uniref:hypothetical protein n=1 Tax=Nocardia wallacei TaxID=480035 RepID=UPI002456A372|nr:hypothetical protein [Nocardia wallacei]
MTTPKRPPLRRYHGLGGNQGRRLRNDASPEFIVAVHNWADTTQVIPRRTNWGLPYAWRLRRVLSILAGVCDEFCQATVDIQIEADSMEVSTKFFLLCLDTLVDFGAIELLADGITTRTYLLRVED